MAARAPKQWVLTKHETITTYESWKQNLLYILSLDVNFAEFLAATAVWLPNSTANQNRGLHNDGDGVAENRRRTAAQKVIQLELMLGQIANFCPIISRNTIVRSSTSLGYIWNAIRLHFGFQLSGAQFLDLANIHIDSEERPEDLYQRLVAFFDDNLLDPDNGITHHGAAVTVAEDITPSLENTIVVIWLKLINPSLPALVKQKYASQLRYQTIASLRPEISLALDSLLVEINSVADSRAIRTRDRSTSSENSSRRRFTKRFCTLCRAARRPNTNHYLSECKFLPESDRRAIARSRLIFEEEERPESDCGDMTDQPYTEDDPDTTDVRKVNIRKVDIVPSPYLCAYYNHVPVQLTIDTGATTNMIKESFARRIQLPISKASQLARQADGETPFNVKGEVPAKCQVIIAGKDTITYSDNQRKSVSCRRTESYLVRGPENKTVILPGDYVQLSVPGACDTNWAIEPHSDSIILDSFGNSWPSHQEISSVCGTIRLVNDTVDPIAIKKHQHLCQIRPIVQVGAQVSKEATSNTASHLLPVQSPKVVDSVIHNISLDPDNMLLPSEKAMFHSLHKDYASVFDPKIPLYNGSSGNIAATVNIGPTLPPQRKGRLPQYNTETLSLLQAKFDELELAGVFAKPEDLNINVEYLNLCFLVKKPTGGHRLVTSFGEIAKYCKPQPSLMNHVDSVLRDIAKWKYIIISYLHHAFYQIPLSLDSMKFCGVSTPYKGIRVYTRAAMGMPGSETCLEELMSRVLGDLVQEGCVAKLADDLYCGGDSIENLYKNWSRVLTALINNNLRLSASKTIVCPKTTNILGWIWSEGTLRASPHRITSLTNVKPPTTVQGLRSFIGAYKVLSRVLQGYADLLHPLDSAVAKLQSKEKIIWTDELIESFKKAQLRLGNCKQITLPKPTDLLWIVTDGAIKVRGLGATLYIYRNEKLLLAGFFNAKLKTNQITWLPCEMEALCIATAIKHFAPFIVQFHQPTQVLTDSRPCVQAFDRLRRGEFSASSRISTFLSTLSRYGVELVTCLVQPTCLQILIAGTPRNVMITAAKYVNLSTPSIKLLYIALL